MSMSTSASWFIFNHARIFSDLSIRLRLPTVSIPQTENNLSTVIVAPSSAVGRFLLQVQQPGTRCQTISAIRRLARTLLGDCWRHTCLRCIRACSALEALRNALYKCFTYLLPHMLAWWIKILKCSKYDRQQWDTQWNDETYVGNAKKTDTASNSISWV